MQSDSNTSARTSPEVIRPKGRVTTLTLTGPASLKVEKGRLRIEDGSAILGTRRTIELEAPLHLERVIALSDGAVWSDHALRMLAEAGGVLYRVRQTGEVEYAILPEQGTCKPALIRAQACLYGTPAGLSIAKWLIGEKIASQEDTLRWISGRATLPGLEEYGFQVSLNRETLQHSMRVEEVMQTEGWAADLYFDAWKGFPVSFKRVEKGCVEPPSHWTRYQGRASLKGSTNRHATDPINALLNFGYAVAAAETLIAIRAAGLEPCLGVLHADKDGRDSFVYDLMEPLRPVVDRLLLELVCNRSFRFNHDFILLKDGVCRVGVELAAEIGQVLSERLRPEAERILQKVKKMILEERERAQEEARQAPKMDGRAVNQPRKVERNGKRPPTNGLCQACGAETGIRRQFCSDCLSKRRSELSSELWNRFKEEGIDPTHGGEAAVKRGDSVIRAQRLKSTPPTLTSA